MRFSIIIPTYNEEKDIADTLEALVKLVHQDKEIIVVDDSTDSTPDIVLRYQNKGVRLIRPSKKEGRCGARNIGIQSADGDIVVIFNADVRPQPDFLNRLILHYENGADYVLVKAEVSNMDDLFARYTDAAGKHNYQGATWIEWSEGFSCKREIAFKAGLFPVGFSTPICAGEDGFFGTELRKIDAKKVIDESIVVCHVAPSEFKEYWQIRKGRGAGTPQIRRFLDRWSYSKIGFIAILKALRRIIQCMTIVPMLYHCFKLAKYSTKNRVLDTFRFCYAWIVEQAAMSIGEFESLFEIIKAENLSKHRHK